MTCHLTQSESCVLRIAGTTWTFEGYSADGQLVIDGTLTVTASPITATGQLILSGSQEGTLEVDMAVDLSRGAPVFSGSVILNGVEFDVAQLAAAAAADGG